ncbi:hypothetical protein AMTR_s00067p00137560 [Amborella trichopoda]|uniref:Uncharacterized protein n=1 Tax=Amborella trichopoda TaxID=13333 RepID=U5CZR5_AMBTC|nr:hypothetical protein AMTR_s00067p00137560 [Amborella trichopoda]
MASITKTHLRLLSLALFMVAMAIVFTEAAAHKSAIDRHLKSKFRDQEINIGNDPLKNGDGIPCDKQQHGANCRMGVQKPYNRGCEKSKGCGTDPHAK